MRRLVLAAATVAPVVALAVACGNFDAGEDTIASAPAAEAGSLEAATPNDGSRADASALDGGDGGACPAGMVRVQSASTNVPFCIDATEVTATAFRDFREAIVAAKHSAAGGANCAWKSNSDYGAAATGTGDTPIRNVDWCEARAYCRFARKRLCRGLDGKPVGLGSDTLFAEWTHACSGPSRRVYPYGNTFNADACVVDGGPPRDVGKGCEGGYPGIFDMAGNVREWEDACDDPGWLDGGANPDAGDGAAPDAGDVLCRVRGGATGDNAGAFACESITREEPRRLRRDFTGIRCCADVAGP